MTNPAPDSELIQQKSGAADDAQSQGEAVYSSRELFRDKTEIRIEHHGALYRLRITRGGGLLLNK